MGRRSFQKAFEQGQTQGGPKGEDTEDCCLNLHSFPGRGGLRHRPSRGQRERRQLLGWDEALVGVVGTTSGYVAPPVVLMPEVAHEVCTRVFVGLGRRGGSSSSFLAGRKAQSVSSDREEAGEMLKKTSG